MDPQPTTPRIDTTSLTVDQAQHMKAQLDAFLAQQESQAGSTPDAPATEPATQAGTVPVNEVVPAPSPAPADEPVPAPTPAHEPEAPELVKFDQPMPLLTKKQDAPSDPVATYDPATGATTGTLPADSKFLAIGKYETAHGVYFSDGTNSVKTVDLSHDPNSDGAPAASDDQGEKIPVHVTPAPVPLPDAWKVMSDTFLGPVQYRVKGSFTVHDLGGQGDDIAVTPETHTPGKEGLDIGGRFTGPDGVAYYRAQSSVDNGSWYGFPVESLQPMSDPADDLSQEEVQDIFNADQAKETEAAAGYTARKVPAIAGTSVGLINRLRGKK